MITDEQVEAFKKAAHVGPHGEIVVLDEEQLKACLEAAERAAWRPIEEAPKDGMPIIIRLFEAEITVIATYDNDPDRCQWKWKIVGGDTRWNTRLATHFRPLPPAPHGGGGDDGLDASVFSWAGGAAWQRKNGGQP